MKNLYLLSFLYLFFTAFSVSGQNYSSELSGVHEVSPVLTRASGAVTAQLTGNTLVVTGDFSGLSSDYQASHIHAGLAGTAGPVIFPLNPTISTDQRSGTFEAANNTFTLTTGQLDTLQNRIFYVNVHSSKHPGGELRGQLVPEADHVFAANAFGSQEVPPVTTGASGQVVADLTGLTLTVSGSFHNLESNYTASHIHVGLPGIAGPVIFPLTVTLSADQTSGDIPAAENIFTLTSGQIDTLLRNEFYVNIHSEMHPGGEIRGQLLPAEADAVFLSPLTGDAENPEVNTMSTGMTAVTLTGDSIHLTGSFSDLETAYTASHIHSGMAGFNGPVVQGLTPRLGADPLSGIFLPSDNKYELTSGMIDTLMMRRLYVNVHTSEHPGGAVRGQLLPLANVYFLAKLDGLHEPENPVTIVNNGAAVVEWLGDSIFLSGGFQGLLSKYDASIGSHIHNALAGVNGPVIFPLNPTVPDDSLSGIFYADSNRFMVTSTQESALTGQAMYVNVHTMLNPSGEVRGQLMTEYNFFPSEASILSPADMASITLSGAETDPFTVDFSDATDPEGDRVVYIWQLGPDADLTIPLLTVNTGTVSQFTTTLGVMDSLLQAAGIAEGQTVTLYHQLMTSDGSLINPADTASVMITRGTVTGNDAKISLTGLTVYPNPTVNEASVSFSSPEAGDMVLKIVAADGRLLLEKPAKISAGENVEKLNLEALEAGIYFLNISSGNTLIGTYKIIIN